MGEETNVTSTDTERRDDYVSKCLKNSEAPIKPEYLIACGGLPAKSQVGTGEAPEGKTEDPKEGEVESSRLKKRSCRGAFKASERSQNLNYIAKLDGLDRLCSSLATFGECRLEKNSCNKSHDLEEFLKAKRLEAEAEAEAGSQEDSRFMQKSCPLFENYGVCHLGLNCEFGLAQHFSESIMANVDGKGERVTPERLEKFFKSFEKNAIGAQLRTELRRKALGFPRTQEFLDSFSPSVARGSEKKGQRRAAGRAGVEKVFENPLLGSKGREEAPGPLPEGGSSAVSDPECEEGAEIPDELKLRPEDMIGISRHDKEVRKSEFYKGRLILAPLTTVGNLPFRRLCLRFGADITVSEMVLCNEILSGKASELALLKRSPEERRFGIQLAGGNKSTIIKTGEFINEHCEFDFIDINAACPLKSLHDKGAGSILVDRESELEAMVKGLKKVTDGKLVSVKVRMSHGGAPINKGLFEKDYYESFENWPAIYQNMKTHKILGLLCDSGIDALVIHGRTAFQRYTKEADWSYIKYCSSLNSKLYSSKVVNTLESPRERSRCQARQDSPSCPSIIGCGDIISFQDYQRHIENDLVDSVMIGRGALLKPWIFTEIKEARNWDISASERFDILKQFASFGLEHWGTDKRGVALTRRFLLEFLSFFHRYIPIGILEQPIHTQHFNWRTPKYLGRNELETLLASSNSRDWIKISEMILGKVSDDFVFVPKHKANSSQ